MGARLKGGRFQSFARGLNPNRCVWGETARPPLRLRDENRRAMRQILRRKAADFAAEDAGEALWRGFRAASPVVSGADLRARPDPQEGGRLARFESLEGDPEPLAEADGLERVGMSRSFDKRADARMRWGAARMGKSGDFRVHFPCQGAPPPV